MAKIVEKIWCVGNRMGKKRILTIAYSQPIVKAVFRSPKAILSSLQSRKDRCGNFLRKSKRKKLAHLVDNLWKLIATFIDYHAHLLRGEAAFPGVFQPMPAGNHIPSIMAVFFRHCHCPDDPPSVNLLGSHEWVNGNHIVERCQLIEPSGQVENTEVLGMAVNGSEHPKKELCLHEGPATLPAVQGTEKDTHNLLHTGTAYPSGLFSVSPLPHLVLTAGAVCLREQDLVEHKVRIRASEVGDACKGGPTSPILPG